MQQAVLGYLAIHATTKEDNEEFDKIFKKIDRNHDGKISKEEFLTGFKTVYPEMSKEEAERIVNEVDVNNNGLIDYIEWTQATTDNKILVTEDNLRDAFNAFDEDHDGNISLDEIKNFLSCGRKIKENAWRKILDEVDINKDGHLDYQEFREMMKSFIS